MVYRYSWLAGLATIAFAFWELTQLLRDSIATTPWQLVVLSGFALGAIITWATVSYRLHSVLVVLINGGVLFLAAARYLAPNQTVLVFPSVQSLQKMEIELREAWKLIQFGVEPVFSFPGLTIIVAAVFWGLGALLVWGLMKRHPFVALIPPLVVALQLATVDRDPTGLARIVVFVVLVAATVMAVNADERDLGAGQMASPGSWPSGSAARPAPSSFGLVAATVVAAVLAVGLLNPVVPVDGTMTWRTSSGLTGDYYGSSISFNPFVSIQRGLAADSQTVAFTAIVDGELAAEDIYFRLLTLESYNGGRWSAVDPKVSSIDADPWKVEDQAYAGPTKSVSATVEILALAQDWLPAPYAPVALRTQDEAFAGTIRVRQTDAALSIKNSRTRQGQVYTVDSLVPALDPRMLATRSPGELSALFATAAGAQEPVPDAVDQVVSRDLADRERFVDLPSDMDGQIAFEARRLTAGLETPFTKGLALEHYFRETGGFTYSTDVTAGHEADTLTSWLLNTDNPDWRTGYCEQFATAMGVMARTLDIPSRVVLGFTPGTRIGNTNTVMIQGKNGHAWVELWIPSQGWVSFDPTPRSDDANPSPTYLSLQEALGFDVSEYLAEVTIPPSEAGGEPTVPPIPFDEETDFPAARNPGARRGSGLPEWISFALLAVMFVAVLAAVVPAVKLLRRRRRMKRLENGDISAAWEEIVARLSDYGAPPNAARTPLELATDVDRSMRPLARVYGRSIYSESRDITSRDVETATESMKRTTHILDGRHTNAERVVSWYRLGRVRSWWRGRAGRD